MSEEIDKLYKKYLYDKLNEIFEGTDGIAFINPADYDKSDYEMISSELSDKVESELKASHPGCRFVIGPYFYEGYARIKMTCYPRNGWSYSIYNYIDKNGNLLLEEWVDKVYDFSYGFAVIHTGYHFGTIINTRGEEILERGNRPRTTRNYAIAGKNYRLKRSEMGDYQIKRSVFGYKCSTSHDTYYVKYKPIKRFGFRYTMCENDRELYLYDRVTKKYRHFGSIEDVQYNDYFIFVRDEQNEERVYLIYENQLIEITEYYRYFLSHKKKLNINPNVPSFLTREEFGFLEHDKIEELLKKEEELRQERRKKAALEKEKKLKIEQQERLQEKKRCEKENEKNRKLEAKRRIIEGIRILQELGDDSLSSIRENVTDLFVMINGIKQINDLYKDILIVINLSLVDFTGVKVDSINFQGCNLMINKGNLDPQKVYNKNMSNCDFTGVYISPFASFKGVNICGSRFSGDYDTKTVDYFNESFKDAIYDENTTYNGRSLVSIFGENTKKRK